MNLLVILLVKLIVLDKLMGGIPIKILEHLIINNALVLAWWTTSSIVYGIGYLAYLPFKYYYYKSNSTNAITGGSVAGRINCLDDVFPAPTETGYSLEYKEETVDDCWELITVDADS